MTNYPKGTLARDLTEQDNPTGYPRGSEADKIVRAERRVKKQIKRNNPSYKYDVKSIILNTMGKKKIKKKNKGGLLVTPRLAKRGF